MGKPEKKHRPMTHRADLHDGHLGERTPDRSQLLRVRMAVRRWLDLRPGSCGSVNAERHLIATGPDAGLGREKTHLVVLVAKAGPLVEQRQGCVRAHESRLVIALIAAAPISRGLDP